MSDITMCPGLGCPQRAECYRYTAPVSEFWQSWADFTTPPRPCQWFLPIEESKE